MSSSASNADVAFEVIRGVQVAVMRPLIGATNAVSRDVVSVSVATGLMTIVWYCYSWQRCQQVSEIHSTRKEVLKALWLLAHEEGFHPCSYGGCGSRGSVAKLPARL